MVVRRGPAIDDTLMFLPIAALFAGCFLAVLSFQTRHGGAMFQSFIQEQVDYFAELMGRSVAIDDVDINLVASSKHFGDADYIRVKAMLERTLDRETIDYLYSFGILESYDPYTYIAPNPDLGVRERYCYPIRHQDQLLGFFWLLGSVEAEEHAIAIKSAKELVAPLLGMSMAREKEFLDQETLARDLISDNPSRVSRAVSLLVRGGRLNVNEEYLVLCIVLESDKPSNMDRDFRQLAHWLGRTTLGQEEDTRNAIHPLLVQLSNELLVILPSRYAVDGYMDLIFDRTVLSKVKIGIGSRANALDLQGSYLQASTIAHILLTLPHFKSVSTWEELGIYGHLMTYLLERKKGMTCMPVTLKVNELYAHDEGLVETLETFLDRAGNVNDTAATLNIHRSTLYYRLAKIEEITKTDLRSGSDRLLLHLEVKLWRLVAHMHTPYDYALR